MRTAHQQRAAYLNAVPKQQFVGHDEQEVPVAHVVLHAQRDDAAAAVAACFARPHTQCAAHLACQPGRIEGLLQHALVLDRLRHQRKLPPLRGHACTLSGACMHAGTVTLPPHLIASIRVEHGRLEPSTLARHQL